VKRVLITLFLFVAMLFVDTFRSIANADKLEMSNPLDRVTLFRNQRNLYLTGIVLFLLLVLYRFQALLNDLFAAEQKAGAVASQAKNSGAVSTPLWASVTSSPPPSSSSRRVSRSSSRPTRRFRR
jgi:hypothetical protein